MRAIFIKVELKGAVGVLFDPSEYELIAESYDYVVLKVIH